MHTPEGTCLFWEALPSPVLATAAHRALTPFRRAHAHCDAPDTRASAGSSCRMDFKPQLPNIHALRGACGVCSLGQLPREPGRARLSLIGWPPAETKNYRGPPGAAAGPGLSLSLGGGRHRDPALAETPGLVPAAGPGAHAQGVGRPLPGSGMRPDAPAAPLASVGYAGSSPARHFGSQQVSDFHFECLPSHHGRPSSPGSR